MSRKIATRKTAEQRREEMDKLQESITAQVETLKDSQAWVDMLKFMQKFKSYSINNLLLILSQYPEASHVAGYQKWRKEFGRQVTKGERGIKIIGGRRAKITQENPTTGEEEEKEVMRFFPCTVFDIAQTEPVEGEAKEIPTLAHRLTGEDEQGITAAVTEWLTGKGWTVSIEPIPGEVNGRTEMLTKRVVIDEALSPAQQAKTALHEAAHVVLHEDITAADYVDHRGVKETEAESASYVVAGLLGIDTSAYTIGYVAGWSGADTELIKSTAANVQHAANAIYDGITHTAEAKELAAA